jgi:hypothetical protein
MATTTAIIVWTCVGTVIIFFIGMFCGTTKWFDRMMRNIVKPLRK